MSLSPKAFADKAAYDRAILREVEARGIDLICLAGYMKVLTPEFCAACKNRILNIIRLFCRRFPASTSSSRRSTGASVIPAAVHFVSAEVDMGAIVLQAVVPVLQNDTAETAGPPASWSRGAQDLSKRRACISKGRLEIPRAPGHVRASDESLSIPFSLVETRAKTSSRSSPPATQAVDFGRLDISTP